MDWAFDWNITKWKILYWFTFQICYWDSIYDVIQDDKLIWGIFSLKTLVPFSRVFWMVKIWPYFHKSIWIVILFLFFQFVCTKKYVFECFTWTIIHMDFVGFLFRTSKFKMTLVTLNISFHIDLGRFVNDWTCIIQILE
jgi:hypothetical protein